MSILLHFRNIASTDPDVLFINEAYSGNFIIVHPLLSHGYDIYSATRLAAYKTTVKFTDGEFLIDFNASALIDIDDPQRRVPFANAAQRPTPGDGTNLQARVTILEDRVKELNAALDRVAEIANEPRP